MKRFPTILALLFGALSACADAPVATTAAAVHAAADGAAGDGRRFELTATVTYLGARRAFGVQDASGFTRLHLAESDPTVLRPGDRIRAVGTLHLRPSADLSHAVCESVRLLSHGKPPPPPDIPLKDIADSPSDASPFDYARIRTHGTVSDLFLDDVDSRYTYLVLSDGSSSVSVPYENRPGERLAPEQYVGRPARVTGICYRATRDQSRRFRRIVSIASPDDVSFLDNGPDDRFAAPELPADGDLSRLAHAPLRMFRTRGRVLAVWQGDSLLLKTAGERPVRIGTVSPTLPECGDVIEVAGFPETDFFHTTLAKAVWRKVADGTDEDEKPLPFSIRRLVSDVHGRPQVNDHHNGQLLALNGKVVGLPSVKNGDGRFQLESEGYVLTADASACPDALKDLTVGCTVAVTGLCVTETEARQEPWSIPRVKGNLLVLRRASDVRVTAAPPWWTPARLLVVICALGFVVVAFGILTEALRRLAERRGKALAEEAVMRAESDFKIYERTRLAIELHDSLSQSLTGISMEMDTAARFAETNPPKMRAHLSVAARTLQACRTELRNCLWDLRNHALELDSVDEAIRQTLEPQIGNTRLSVRFNVDRGRLSDNTMHAILKIIRELASNAVRHGKATSVRVAGSIEEDKLLFSVRDNGLGFDTANCPGIESGHYGLQGIRERVENLEGEMTLVSAPDAGTKVTIALNIPREVSS